MKILLIINCIEAIFFVVSLVVYICIDYYDIHLYINFFFKNKNKISGNVALCGDKIVLKQKDIFTLQ